jgi:hypothetical protein
MWTVRPLAEYATRRRKWAKKRWRELSAAEINLETYRIALATGVKPLQIKYGFIHPEGNGVVAIDQHGHGKSLAETRLYVYPDTETDADEMVLYLLTIGDKNTQARDIQFCKEFVASLKNKKAHPNGGKDAQSPGTDEEVP